MTAKNFPQATSIAAILAAASQLLDGQGTFQNLDFEQAVVPIVPAGQGGDPVAVSSGVPGWTVYLGGIPQSSMFHNDISLGAAEVAIYGPQWFPSLILEGSYTVSLQPSTAGPPTSAAIGQTGQIPAGTQSIRFYGTGGYTVTFAGQQIPISAIGNGPNYTIFAGDIFSFAGQTGELRIQGGGLLDNILFSNQQAPEPTVVGLLALGAVALAQSRRKRAR
jgi:hypothetical protein